MLPHGDIFALYDLWAAQYDQMPNPTKALSRRVLPRLLPDVRGKRILEAGCGSGQVLAEFCRGARAVVGMDASREMLRIARRRLGKRSALLLRCDLTRRWPVADATFDLVVIALVLEHIAELEPIFREVHRVLASRGELIVVELHPVRQRRGVRARFVERESGLQREIPAVQHSRQEFEQAAKAAAFSHVELRDWFDEIGGAEPRLLSLQARRG